MKDKGTGAENLIWLASRQGGRAHPSSLAADDILAGLTGRIAELEARVSAILAEVEPEPPRVESESGRALSAPKADKSRGTDKMSRDARVEADAELTRASEERRMLATEMRLLREAFQEARSNQLSAGAGANAIERRIAPDVRAAIADEMRSLLTELLADFRAQAAPPPPTAAVVETTEAVVATPGVPEQLVEDVDTVAPVADRAATIEAPIESVESVIEPADEFVRPAFTEPIVEEDVEELRRPEPIAPADIFAAEPAPVEPAAGTVEESFAAEAPAVIEPIPFEPALPEAAPLPVDTHVFEPIEPPAPIVDDYEELRRQAIELTAAPAEPTEPVVDEYVEEFRRPEAPAPIEAIEPTAPPADQIEPFVADYMEDVVRHEPIEPMIDPHVVPANDVTMTPPAPLPAPDTRLAALWDAASLPTELATAPDSPVEPAAFVTEEFIAETNSLEIPEAPYPPQEFPLEQTIELTPPPPVEFTPLPPLEFAPEPSAIVEPEPAPTFPELRVADDAGLHQIQIVISPIHSFSRLLETEARIRALSTVNALHLRDFRNGVATFAVAVGEAISPAEFGAVIQMLQELHLRLEGTTQTTVELRAEDELTAS
ncbi:MAG: hypothetical protein E6I49_00775 [Chloroflexi bacterium]|nr:MAG: hypothetical protein E6I49_00775 [Chloroflexota bacterium]